MINLCFFNVIKKTFFYTLLGMKSFLHGKKDWRICDAATGYQIEKENDV